MSATRTFDSLFTIRSRFVRSISLVRDIYSVSATQGYVLTPIGRDLLRRFAEALSGTSATRAWSITGPYGSGKSAFALFAAQLLAGEDLTRASARKLLASGDSQLSERLFGPRGVLPRRNGRLCPVLVTGSRRPLSNAIAASLATALRAAAQRGRPPQIVEHLERLADSPAPASTAIVHLFEQASEYLDRFGPDAAGILLIIDELGKFLEYGANHPEQGDVFVLQELAEVASRSRRPFLFLTILHQSIDRYAEHLSAGRRTEWAKVQGRFEDVAFEERTDQILRLLTHAIDRSASTTAPVHQAKVLAQSAIEHGVRLGNMTDAELRQCLADCYPLHPLTAVILGPLFRQLAQNERSLFAFLVSSEPAGFQEFLQHTPVNAGCYRLDQLFDYVMASLGPALFAQHRGKLWAEVQSALERLPDASELEVRVAKTVGLLQAIGPSTGVRASKSTICFALQDAASPAGIEEAIDALCRRSLVVFRRHSGSYALWEGSDVDLDERLNAARASVEREVNLAAFLSRHAPAQSLIARRHYFQTGTMRFFEARYVDSSSLQADLFRSTLLRCSDTADGSVVYCVPRDAADRERMRSQLPSATELPTVVALPLEVLDLQEFCHELACLRWIMSNTPELETDRTARRELQARLAIAEQSLHAHLEWVFSPTNPRCEWYHQTHNVTLTSQRQLNDLLSRVCDEVYSATPHWRNELINRRQLSTSAAKARRNLIEAMFECSDKEYLGFTGHPPERSMYEVLLRTSRLHRKRNGSYGFHGPDARCEPAVRELWDAIDLFLAETESGRKTVQALFDRLRRPPFGLKDGVLPVVLAAVLVHCQTEIALYEEGSFVPHPNAATFERMFRGPEKFELQRFFIAGPRAEVFQQYARLLNGARDDSPTLLSVVRPLVRVVKDLPEFVTKTRQISEHAQRILRCVREARQPDRLLFADLPVACNVAPFATSGEIDRELIENYFGLLRDAFAELQRAYPALMGEIERIIMHSLRRTGPLSTARKNVEHEARMALNVAVDIRLKAYLLRLADNTTDDSTWLESIATLLAGKPPVHWDDEDRARFEVQQAAMSRAFDHFRVLAFEMERAGAAILDGDPRLLRVSVTVPNANELERVVQIPSRLQKHAELAKEDVLRVLKEHELMETREIGVAVLAELVRQLLGDGPPRTAERTQ